MTLCKTNMKIINARDYGIVPEHPQCQQSELERLFREIPDGCTVIFEKGCYLIDKTFLVEDKKNIIICGNETVFVSHFEPEMSLRETPGMFYFKNCHNLIIKNLNITTEFPTNCTGYVTGKDVVGETYDFRPVSGFFMTGSQRIMAQNSCDEEGTPDYRLFCYQENSYDVLENGDIRIHVQENPKVQLERLQVGQQVCLRHTTYGKEFFIFENCHTVNMEDVTVYSAPGAVVKVLPHCSNFTFLRFNIKLEKGSKCLFSANADGIHIKGMSGKLILKDCVFEQMGDDALNIHSTAALVDAIDIDKKTIQCVGGRGRALFENWAEPQALIEVYDPKTFLKKASVHVENYCNGVLTYSEIEGKICEGDVLANTMYYASVHIDHCTVKNCRARAFLLQSRDVTVENCNIYGMSYAAILIAPDIDWWYEVGPAKNVILRNNIIEKCAYASERDNLGAIILKASHGKGYANYPCGVHENIEITGNVFENIPVSAVFISATDGIVIRENRMKNCCMAPSFEDLQSISHSVALCNCDHVVLEDNDYGVIKGKSLYMQNCTNVLGGNMNE